MTRFHGGESRGLKVFPTAGRRVSAVGKAGSRMYEGEIMQMVSAHRVLIVEDESIVAEDLQLRLKRMDFQVVGIGTSEKTALELTEHLQPDLILMDIRLEGPNDGISAALDIRRRWQVPVVFLTAQADGNAFELAKSANPFGFLLKPIDDRELKIGLELALYKHQMEKALRESESRFRVLFEQATVGVAELDAETGNILRLNSRFADIHGFPIHEVQPHQLKKLSHPEDLAVEQEQMKNLHLGMTREITLEKRHIRKDGAVIWVTLTISTVDVSDNQRRRYIAVLQDITEKKRAEEKILEQLTELKRWYDVTLNREYRIHKLKDEVNELLARIGEEPRYVHPEEGMNHESKNL